MARFEELQSEISEFPPTTDAIQTTKNDTMFNYDDIRNKSRNSQMTKLKETSKEQNVKFDNPLNDSIVSSSLQKLQLTGKQLIEMSVKDLNRRLSEFPPNIITKLKRCRRTMKNRGYAKNCRIKRINVKNQLEQINTELLIEIKKLRQRNELLVGRLNELISKVNSIEMNRLSARANVTTSSSSTTSCLNNHIHLSSDYREIKHFPNSEHLYSSELPSIQLNNTTNDNIPRNIDHNQVAYICANESSYYPIGQEIDYLNEPITNSMQNNWHHQ